MMGKDIERVLRTINTFKDLACEKNTELSFDTSYKIAVDPFTHLEIPEERPAIKYTKDIWNTWLGFQPGDYQKMCILEQVLYTSSNSFNNNYASPWTELHRLVNAIIEMKKFADAHAMLPWMGDKVALLNLLQNVLTRAVDSNRALIYYHDYIQRGYDHVFNGNTPSVTFKTTIERNSIGNLKQVYYENVNMPGDNYDPY